VTDYLPAIFDEEMKEYFQEFQAAMPAYAATFNLAGSFEADDVGAWYRSPVELGWAKNIKFDHEFIGRQALEVEVARPKRTMKMLVWNADDVVDVFASLFRRGKPYHYMEIPRDQRGFMYADKVLKDGKLVGVATSRGYSYYFRQMLSLCVIDSTTANLARTSRWFGVTLASRRGRFALRLPRLPTKGTVGGSTSANFDVGARIVATRV
jgi:glycine cleavage system aminomethyltransferase T